MKTILVATDFSYNASNAVDYAADFGTFIDAKLILLHVFNIPVLPPEGMPIIPPTEVIETMKAECLLKLNETKDELERRTKKRIKIECICREGIVVEEINRLIDEKNIDMVILGIKGKNTLIDLMIGSTTVAYIENGHCPLLAINEYVSFRKIKKIVLACGDEPLTTQAVIRPLEEILTIFKAQLCILNVVSQPALTFSGSKVNASVSFENMFEGLKHSVHFVESEDVIEGINEFSEKKSADIIAIIPAKHSQL